MIAVVKAMGRWLISGRPLPRLGLLNLRYSVPTNIKRLNVMEAYCVKCKTKVDIKDPRAIKMKNGRAATTGFCPKCETKVFRIGATN